MNDEDMCITQSMLHYSQPLGAYNNEGKQKTSQELLIMITDIP